MPPLLASLAAAGIPARVLAWDDPAEQADILGAAACLIRSTWNDAHQHERFCAWVDSCWRGDDPVEPGTGRALEQPQGIPAGTGVERHSDCRYRPGLGRAGLSVGSLAEVMGTWTDVVVKPAVSAGSFGTLRVNRGETGPRVRQHLG